MNLYIKLVGFYNIKMKERSINFLNLLVTADIVGTTNVNHKRSEQKESNFLTLATDFKKSKYTFAS